MREYTHLASGVMFGLMISENPYVIGLVTLGALFPDLDSNFSLVSKIFENKSGNGNGLLKHRGFLHTFTSALLIYTAYFVIFRNNIILPFIFGYCLHIFLDSFTPAGVKIFSPFFKTKIRLGGGKIKTGSISDKALGTIFAGLSVGILLFRIIK